ERRVSLSAWLAGSYGSPTVYNCDRSKKCVPPKSTAKTYDDERFYLRSSRCAAWNASAVDFRTFLGPQQEMRRSPDGANLERCASFIGTLARFSERSACYLAAGERTRDLARSCRPARVSRSIAWPRRRSWCSQPSAGKRTREIH